MGWINKLFGRAQDTAQAGNSPIYAGPLNERSALDSEFTKILGILSGMQVVWSDLAHRKDMNNSVAAKIDSRWKENKGYAAVAIEKIINYFRKYANDAPIDINIGRYFAPLEAFLDENPAPINDQAQFDKLKELNQDVRNLHLLLKEKRFFVQ
jgi:hypothetical protein